VQELIIRNEQESYQYPTELLKPPTPSYFLAE